MKHFKVARFKSVHTTHIVAECQATCRPSILYKAMRMQFSDCIFFCMEKLPLDATSGALDFYFIDRYPSLVARDKSVPFSLQSMRCTFLFAYGPILRKIPGLHSAQSAAGVSACNAGWLLNFWRLKAAKEAAESVMSVPIQLAI